MPRGLTCIILPHRCVFRFRVCVLPVFWSGEFIALMLCVFPALILFFFLRVVNQNGSVVFVAFLLLWFSFCCSVVLALFYMFFFVLRGLGARGTLIWKFIRGCPGFNPGPETFGAVFKGRILLFLNSWPCAVKSTSTVNFSINKVLNLDWIVVVHYS